MHEDSPLLQAIDLYADITGVAVPKDDSFRGSFSEYEVRQTYEALKEALELDPSEVTANLMLSYYTRQILSGQSLSMLDLLTDPDAYLAKLDAPRRLLAIVNRPEIAAARDAFVEGVRKGLEIYNAAARPDIMEALAQHDRIAFLRRDALRGVEKLSVHQFLSGAPEADSAKPVFHTKVFQWWNINSLLQAALTMPSGVSLNLIRDRDVYQSYFVFCIRNGGNLFVLSDVPQHAHPLQRRMTRRPERHLGERASKAWFPYDLLGLEWDEESEEWFVRAVDTKAVAIYQQKYKPLKHISDLEPNETIWVAMMLDLIVKKFWKAGYQTPELSYTGEMLKIEDRLIAAAKNLPVDERAYQPISLKPLTIDDVSGDKVREDQIGAKGNQPNRWLEERYKDRVNPAILNVVEQIGTKILLPSDDSARHVQDATTVEGGLVKIPAWKLSQLGYFAKREIEQSSHGLEAMDSTKFGTRDEIEADRLFIARYNMATQIDDLANQEYEERRESVKTWYAQAAKANLPTLLRWAAHDEIWLDEGKMQGFSSIHAGGHLRRVKVKDASRHFHPWENVYRTFAVRCDLSQRDTWDLSRPSSINLGTSLPHGHYGCAVTGQKASYVMHFFPATARELAVICACTVEQLPDVLRHWTLHEPYIGNSILDRIDPMAWHLDDPWKKLRLQVFIPLSKRGLAQVMKMPEMPPLPNVVDASVARE